MESLGSGCYLLSSWASRTAQDDVQGFFVVQLHLDFQNDIVKRFRYVLSTRIALYYLPFSDLSALPARGASISIGKGNTIMLLFSVAMTDKVCK
jgi:hypothetical protein